MLLHETTIASFKRNLAASTPSAEPRKETRQDFQARVARVAKEANSKCDLRLLCCEYLTHLEMLVQTNGDRLKK